MHIFIHSSWDLVSSGVLGLVVLYVCFSTSIPFLAFFPYICIVLWVVGFILYPSLVWFLAFGWYTYLSNEVSFRAFVGGFICVIFLACISFIT